ncbi:Mss4-like protein [Neolentinus lepideus HHB14362 ss-1]|uniref:Mss4-like protein n=1 Tax=Neolentinus lepideus HHB14362 ss-1 TaxID=1314782 RepID=A0A165SS49_9AGAM|nr:Mss4-like protein [Neolentinus lepideus HHB14362 ss-1]
MPSSSNVLFDLVKPEEIEDAYKIEVAGYPEDEAASLEAFRYRQINASDLFYGAFVPKDAGGRELIGYVCSTLSPSPSLTQESMSTHIPSSSSVCVHSVCVSPSHRKQGVATNLLKAYVSHLEQLVPSRGYARVLLITHEELRHFFENAGFEWLGKSRVVHGSKPWYEMRKIISSSEDPWAGPSTSQSQQIPAGLWEALQSPSSRPKRTTKLLGTFSDGLQDVTSENSNKFDLLCPRDGCGSIILKSGAATLTERPSIQLEPPEFQTSLAPLPDPQTRTHWWLVTPSPMAFENIGFSKPLVGSTNPNMKLLACAECDLGPLGWCEQGGKEFWLAAGRVRYSV